MRHTFFPERCSGRGSLYVDLRSRRRISNRELPSADRPVLARALRLLLRMRFREKRFVRFGRFPAEGRPRVPPSAVVIYSILRGERGVCHCRPRSRQRRRTPVGPGECCSPTRCAVTSVQSGLTTRGVIYSVMLRRRPTPLQRHGMVQMMTLTGLYLTFILIVWRCSVVLSIVQRLGAETVFQCRGGRGAFVAQVHPLPVLRHEYATTSFLRLIAVILRPV
mmetsp:Transcript_28105/g.71233  ORF Transcript_28105/g.71233 Transcript_28105/m.71233 type:complete len:221 (-) Transcript_28105:675-1337(-)